MIDNVVPGYRFLLEQVASYLGLASLKNPAGIGTLGTHDQTGEFADALSAVEAAQSPVLRLAEWWS